MMLRERLSYANIASTLALVLAVAGLGGGVAYAHGKVGSGDLKKNAVKSKHIKNGKVKSKDIKNNNVKSKDIKNGQVKSDDIADNSLTGADVSNGSLGTDDMDAAVMDGLVIGGINVGDDGTVNSWFNRMGGKPTLTKGGTGEYYAIDFPGVPAGTDDSVIAVVNNSWSGADTCNIFDVDDIDGTMDVYCVNVPDGSPADSDFMLLLYKV